MKMEELKGKSADELKAMEADMRKELFNLRFQQASGEEVNTSRFNQVKKDIARVLTFRNQQKKAA